MVRNLGEVVALSAQPWEGMPRWWVQYSDGAQLDLVVAPADERPGRAPGAVVLLDRSGGRFATEFVPKVLHAAPHEPEQWLLDGWEALSNVAKYLRRGSTLEAIEQIHRARQRVFQLWSVGEHVDYPRFGLTSLLDATSATLPPNVESTYCLVGQESATAAACALARLLRIAGRHANPALDTPLSEYVIAELTAQAVHGASEL